MNAMIPTTSTIVSNAATGGLTALHDVTRDLLPARPLSTEATQAWHDLPKVYGTVRTPEPGNPWTSAEIANAAHALETARRLRDVAAEIEKAVTDGYLTGLDHAAIARAATDPAYAEQLRSASTNRSGHYALGAPGSPVQTPIPGTGEVLSAEYKQGKPQISVEALRELRAARKLTWREYHRLVRTVTVVDTDALTKALTANVSLRGRLREAWTMPTPSISVHVRRPKNRTATV